MNWYKECKLVEAEWSWKRFLALPLLSIATMIGIDRLVLDDMLSKHNGNEEAVKTELVQRVVDQVNVSPAESPQIAPPPVDKKSPPVTETESRPVGTITNNFNMQEFASKDGSETPTEVQDNIVELTKNLQVLREEIGKPISITSGYRSPEHNKKVGGKPNSQHIKGNAADIQVSGISSKQIHAIIERLIDEGKMNQGGLGLYPSFVHYDTRGHRSRW